MRFRLTAICIALLASRPLMTAPVTWAATPPSPSDVHVVVDPASSPLLEIEVIEAEARLGRDFEVFLRIRNLGTELLENIEVSIEHRDAQGRARSHESSVRTVALASGAEVFIGRLSDHFQPRPGDRFLIAAQPFAEPHPSGDTLSSADDWQQVGISQCISYCNRCADKALALCGASGTAEYDCQCGDSSVRCSFKCKV
jgi:hypothetical protein